MPPNDRDRDDRGGGGVRRDVNELRDDVERLDRHSDRLDARVDHLDEISASSREAIGKLQGEMSLMGVSYQRIAEITTTGVITDLEIKKQAALAEIRERTEKGKARRKLLGELLFKGIAIAMGAWGLLYAALSKGC